uniref:Putative endonuclease/reverse transcriptase n=1 Tax=Rhipicephalus microplus TaxID=6941 RepID=A0A6G5AAT1_RHIMP
MKSFKHGSSNKVKSSGGPEGIPNEFFRRYAEPLSKYLVTIFEASIRTAMLPKELKMARVKPIPKKGDPLLVFNYRPISIISSCSKMLEHIVTTFISKHLDEHNFLSPYNRSQFVCINNQNSILLPVTSGVPQGSVLGPLLFLIYCNDVVNCVNPPVNVRLFADDCILFNLITSANDQAALQSTLNNICLWCN